MVVYVMRGRAVSIRVDADWPRNDASQAFLVLKAWLSCASPAFIFMSCQLRVPPGFIFYVFARCLSRTSTSRLVSEASIG